MQTIATKNVNNKDKEMLTLSMPSCFVLTPHEGGLRQPPLFPKPFTLGTENFAGY